MTKNPFITYNNLEKNSNHLNNTESNTIKR